MWSLRLPLTDLHLSSYIVETPITVSWCFLLFFFVYKSLVTLWFDYFELFQFLRYHRSILWRFSVTFTFGFCQDFRAICLKITFSLAAWNTSHERSLFSFRMNNSKLALLKLMSILGMVYQLLSKDSGTIQIEIKFQRDLTSFLVWSL